MIRIDVPKIPEGEEEYSDYEETETGSYKSVKKKRKVAGTPAFTKQLLSAYRLSNKPSTQRRRTKKVPTTYTNGGAF